MSEGKLWNWSNGTEEDKLAQSNKVIDISFKLKCQCLHVDHACGLSKAISNALPWFQDEPLAGLHLIHVAGSQNGWMRPEKPDQLLYPSRRTRLMIRIPIHRIKDTQTLTGKILDIDGYTMEISEAAQKPVTPTDILLSRYVITKRSSNENEFLSTIAMELKGMNIRFKKLLPGRQIKLHIPHGVVTTISLMVADIDPVDSLTLQERGIGQGRKHGCGIFIHHKGIKAGRPDSPEN